jgi:asparagine synthase (glutamine-hydrolysing)
MCGIVALFAYGASAAPVETEELRRIRDAMAIRGPDGTGELFTPDNRVALGHRRLSIIDLRAIADQPMIHDGGRLAIVFNGEIYNYQVLKAELEQQGRVFRTNSDTEVLLQLYDRDGADMVQRLRGMYTLAIWDRARGGMLLGRDPFGIKPLYYADDGKTLRIASQVKALLASGRVDTRPEPAGHAGFFLWGNVPDPFTLYRGIKALPAGSTMWIDHDGAHAPQRFFETAHVLAEGAAKPAPRDERTRHEWLREALIDSIQHHFVADVPVGVFLSAGRDSTTIAALATESGADNLITLTLGFREFQGTANDETTLAEEVARQRATRHRTSWVLGEQFAAERDKLLVAMDQPSIDGVNTYFVSKAAHESGLKVALSGLGGDELFGGYPSFHQIPRMADTLGHLPWASGPGRVIRRLSQGWLGGLTSPKYAGLLEYGTSVAGAYLLRRSLFMPWELPQLMPREMAIEGLATLDTVDNLAKTVNGIANPRLAVAALELDWYMRHQLLRDSDWAGMAHALEIRVPFVDIELLRRLAPLIASQHPPDKREMAASPRQPLPAGVIERAKTGFVVPVRDWIAGERGAAQKPERGLRGWAKRVYAVQAAQ